MKTFRDFKSMGDHWHAANKTKGKKAVDLDTPFEPKLTVTLRYDTAIPDEQETSIGYRFDVFRATDKGKMRSVPWYARTLRIDGGMIRLPIAPAMRLLAA
jgi:hypothetical protein